MADTLGVLETRTIASGVLLLDAMLKAAEVSLLRASPICSGRYLIQLFGDRAAVASSMEAAVALGRPVVASCLLSGLDARVFAALRGLAPGPLTGGAVGLVECGTATAGIQAADIGVKSGDVNLSRLVLAQGINGKSYLIFGGTEAAVQASLDAVTSEMGRRVLDTALLNRPDPMVVEALIPTGRKKR